MAVVVSSTCRLPNPRALQLNPTATHIATRVFPANSSTNHFNKSIKLSSRRFRLTVPAVSESSAIGSAASSLVSEDPVDVLDGVKVFDLNGNSIPISDLWKDRKAVVAFARHFGCILCRQRADYLASKKDVMDAAGVALVLIGPGTVDQAKSFVEQTKFELEVYADPSRSSYEALKFVYGIATTFSPTGTLKMIQAHKEGYRQDWKLTLEEDTLSSGGWQQGGIVVAGPGKTNIAYIHKDKEAGDDPDIKEVLAACCS